MHVALWAFEVRPGSEGAFEEAYGSRGAWVRLFRRGRGFVETRLLREEGRSGHYLTLDVWESEGAYQRFRADFAADYAALDQECEGLTVAERSLGTYRSL